MRNAVVITTEYYDTYGTNEIVAVVPTMKRAEAFLREYPEYKRTGKYFRCIHFTEGTIAEEIVCFHFHEDWKETCSRYSKSLDSYTNVVL